MHMKKAPSVHCMIQHPCLLLMPAPPPVMYMLYKQTCPHTHTSETLVIHYIAREKNNVSVLLYHQH